MSIYKDLPWWRWWRLSLVSQQ